MFSFLPLTACARKLFAMTPRQAVCLSVMTVAVMASSHPAHAANKSKLSTYQSGKPVVGLPCEQLPTRTAVLMGGGADVKQAFSWMIEKINQCGASKLGNFVVIRVRGNPAYDSFINKQGALASVQTLVIPTRETADDPELDSYIQNAAAIWITGGDQGDYYATWKGTRLERLVHEQVKQHGIPIGGTSAGMMILSEFNYLASPNSITSADALADPYKTDAMTLAKDFWTDSDPINEPSPFPLLNATVTDSHFDTRDRMGRLTAFLGRVIADGWAAPGDARAVGVDQETALLLEYNESKTQLPVMPVILSNPGVNGSAYILGAGKTSVLNIAPSQFTFTNIQVTKLSAGRTFNYLLHVNDGVMTSENNGGSLY